jgi:hypothetical protein
MNPLFLLFIPYSCTQLSAQYVFVQRTHTIAGRRFVNGGAGSAIRTLFQDLTGLAGPEEEIQVIHIDPDLVREQSEFFFDCEIPFAA